MELGIKDKRALITGAGRGLGKVIALELDREGVSISAVSRTKSDLDKLLIEMGGENKRHYAIVADLTIEHAPELVFKELEKNFGPVDILVNNLGGALNIKDPFCSVYDWRKIWRMNFEVGLELNNLIIPYMKKKSWGRIINISSISGSESQGPLSYCSVKAALNAYTKNMGRILAPYGIIMAAVSPGAVLTEGGYWDTTMRDNPKYAKKYLDERMPIKRFGKPEEIASMVAFLCSKQSSFCAGSIFPVDGGQGKCFSNS